MHNSKNKEQSMICFADDKKRKIILIEKYLVYLCLIIYIFFAVLL